VDSDLFIFDPKPELSETERLIVEKCIEISGNGSRRIIADYFDMPLPADYISMDVHGDKILFQTLIKAKTDFDVYPIDENTLSDISALVELAIDDYKRGTPYTGRVNEFGNHMEKVLLNTDPTYFYKPHSNKVTKKGNTKKQQMGYPDLAYSDPMTTVACASTKFYVEVKVFKQGSDDDKFRSFYLSTFDKITSSAAHVVVAFEHDGNKILTGKYHIVDMYDKILTLKKEYNCSNAELYGNQ